MKKIILLLVIITFSTSCFALIEAKGDYKILYYIDANKVFGCSPSDNKCYTIYANNLIVVWATDGSEFFRGILQGIYDNSSGEEVDPITLPAIIDGSAYTIHTK